MDTIVRNWSKYHFNVDDGCGLLIDRLAYDIDIYIFGLSRQSGMMQLFQQTE